MLWNRSVKVDIQLEGVTKSYNNLKIDFSIEKSTGGLGESAEITLTGLNIEDINYLTKTISYENIGAIKNNKIQISGGYDNNLSLLYVGNLTEAIPNLLSSDYQINIKAISNYMAKETKKYTPTSLKDATLKQVCTEISNLIGYKLIFEASDKKIGDYSFYGDPLHQLNSLRVYNIEAYTSDEVLYITDNDKPNSSFAVLISGESGLIGSPAPFFKGVKITTLLNPSFSIGGTFILKAQKLSVLNGTYKIYTLKHKGSNRSKDWISEVEGRLY